MDTAPPQFTVDRKALVAFLARCRRRWYGKPAPGGPDREDWQFRRAGAPSEWKPRELESGQLYLLEDLIPQAIAAGALVCPPGWRITLDTFEDETGGWYQWRARWASQPDTGVVSTLGFAVTGESLEDLCIIGAWDAAGTVAAAAVILEARDYGNHLLADFYGLLTSPGRHIRQQVLGIHAPQIPHGENQPGNTRV